LVLVGVAIVGSLAALAGVLVGGLLTYSSEYRKWLRSARHEAVTELLVAGEAFKRHSAARIVARYSQGVDLGQQAERYDPETHLADLERISLACEAMRTLFPTGVMVLVDEFRESAQALPLVELNAKSANQPANEQPGSIYAASRANLIRSVRIMIAASLTERLRPRLQRWYRRIGV
jgi:hypothetical protein